jgi:ribonuclease P protein component
LTHPRQIEAVFAFKRSEAGPRLVLYGKPNDLTINRIAIVIGKKAGNSVVRHRFKRIVREAFRQSKTDQPLGWDWIVLPRFPSKSIKGTTPPNISEWTTPEIRGEMIDLMRRQSGRENRRRRTASPTRPPLDEPNNSSQEAGQVPTPPPG